MRKLPALLLAYMLCLLFVCPSAGAARSGSGTLVSGDYEYTLQDNGTAVITRFTGNADVVVIPARLDGIPVSALGEKSFAWCPSLLDVTIPEGITSIGDYAFLYCTGLAAVFMPDSLTDIGRNPFQRHHRTGSRILRYFRLLRRRYIHNNAALQHLREISV